MARTEHTPKRRFQSQMIDLQAFGGQITTGNRPGKHYKLSKEAAAITANTTAATTTKRPQLTSSTGVPSA